MSEGADKEYGGGFVPLVRADGDVTLREAAALGVVAGGNADFKEGGAGLFVAGGDLHMHQSGSGNLIVGGNAELSQSGCGQLVAFEANVTDGKVGVLLAGKANLQQSEIVATTQQAVGFGVAAGVVFFLLSKLFRRG